MKSNVSITNKPLFKSVATKYSNPEGITSCQIEEIKDYFFGTIQPARPEVPEIRMLTSSEIRSKLLRDKL